MAQEQFKEALPETFLNTLLQGSRCAFLSSLPRVTVHIGAFQVLPMVFITMEAVPG